MCAWLRSRVQASDHRRDRKSTRLNSSHTVSSYAVFCLKKKTCDYGRFEATWTLADVDGHRADAPDGTGPVFHLSTDLLIGIEGGAARRRHVLAKRDRPL